MRTIDQAAKEFSLDETEQSIFAAGVEFAQRWIPVEEELPDYDIPVLFVEMNRTSNPYLGHRSKLIDNFVSMALSYKSVTHWRPIELK